MYKKLEFDNYKNCVLTNKIFDNELECEYIFTKIKKNIDNNERIFPRVRMIYNDDIGSKSVYEYMQKEEILFAINAGIFNTSTNLPECLLICNKKIIIDQNETYIHQRLEDGGNKRKELYILGIDSNGNFKIYNPGTNAQEILDDGCVDAVMGFVPLIIDFKEKENVDKICSYHSYDRHPRQIIGDLDDEYYFIMSVLKPGMNFNQLRRLLIKKHVKMAYNLDGGSSTQTLFYKDMLTPIYKDEKGRRVPTIITFEVITGNFIV